MDRSNSSIAITVKLFAVYQEVFGKPELNLNFPQPTTVDSVLDYLIEQKPELAKWRDITRFGVNLKFVEADTLLEDSDEVVLIPPVSGG
ncbi:MoaD/ThiS family protein [Myxosarcina sp. GI1]|uniref:MoaD/ThiS family protein n=1 Tax=Myxosarcina sp. GI1 TaxID=1541065 RepID=UPI00056D5FB3|nr:MoaD/ThiS family protein [Myxosarcina sp. GI1]